MNRAQEITDSQATPKKPNEGGVQKNMYISQGTGELGGGAEEKRRDITSKGKGKRRTMKKKKMEVKKN